MPLFLDPETAQIHPKTNAIPDVFGGTKLDIRSVFLNVNRNDFTLNGTNCRKGGDRGRDQRRRRRTRPNPAAYSAFKVSDEFQATGCNKLKFRPKLKIRLFGKTQRAKHPKLRAVLKARGGRRQHPPGLGRAAARALPRPGEPRQRSAPGSSSPPTNARRDRSTARPAAFTPLLGKPLEGPVYLRSSNNTLPDMVAHLEGQVDIDLVGRIDSFNGGIRTTFGRVPDVPVTKFVLTLPGGKKGLLVNSTNLCAKPVKAIIRIKAQNGKKPNKQAEAAHAVQGKKKRRSSSGT